MAELILIRHGETETNRKGIYTGQLDVPLNERGRAQAAEVGERLRAMGRTPEVCWCGDLKRTVETARLAVPYLEPHTDPGFREINLGILEGHTYAEAYALWPEMTEAWYRNRDYTGFRLPGAETNRACYDRSMKAADRILSDSGKDSVILLVAHSTILCLLLSGFLTGSPDHMLSFDVQNARITTLRIDGNKARLTGLNL